MRNYRSFFLITTLLVVSSASVRLGLAEVACSSEITYRWSKGDKDQPAIEANGAEPKATLAVGSPAAESAAGGGTPKPAAAGNGAANSQAAGADQAKQEGVVGQSSPSKGELLVRYASVERRGADEETVRAALAPELNRQKARAYERCRRDHEAFGDCVSTKLSVKTSTLNSLSFSARAQVEQALMEECRAQQGRCVAVDSSEIKCRPIGAAPAAAEAGQAAPEGAKEGVKEGAKAAGEEAPKAAEGDAKKAKPAKK
jgi:hypothetical protein